MFSLKPSEDIELSIRYLLSVCLGIAIGMFSHPSQKDLYKLYNSYKSVLYINSIQFGR